MKKGFISLAAIGIGLVSAAIGTVLIFNYVPIGWFKYFDFSPLQIGTTVTDISTATRFADFPAIYNANNLALNAGKIEVSTTTLPLLTTLSGLTSIGTITTGIWNATPLTVSYGGTGSTTLSAYQVLLGNGTGNIGVVSGLGTSGMSLVSTGAGSAPTWQSVGVDQSEDYTWTGLHTFNGGLIAGNATTTNATSTMSAVSGKLTVSGLLSLTGTHSGVNLNDNYVSASTIAVASGNTNYAQGTGAEQAIIRYDFGYLNQQSGMAILVSGSATSTNVGGVICRANACATYDYCTYALTWTGTNINVAEVIDGNAACEINGIISWYK